MIYRKIGSLLLANLRYHDELGLYLDEELVGGLSHRVRELFGQLYNMQLQSIKWFVSKEKYYDRKRATEWIIHEGLVKYTELICNN